MNESQIPALQYQGLTQPVTSEDIAAYKKTIEKPATTTKKIFTAIGVLGLLALLSYFAVIMIRDGFNVGLIIGPIFIALVFFIFKIAMRATVKKRIRLTRFASDNGLIVSFTGQPTPPEVGMIFDEGHSRMYPESVTFPDNTVISNYQYTTGSGKNQQTHTWTYARFDIDRSLPHMVFDARSNNALKRFSNLPDSLKRSQRLQLEGNFNDHFDVYVPQQYEQDALYVFTPDVMAAFIDAGAKFDIEIIDQKVYLYTHATLDLTSQNTYEMFVGAINGISRKLKSQSRNYADSRVGNRTLNVVAEPGRRLKSGVGIGTVLTFIAILLYAGITIYSTINR